MDARDELIRALYGLSSFTKVRELAHPARNRRRDRARRVGAERHPGLHRLYTRGVRPTPHHARIRRATRHSSGRPANDRAGAQLNRNEASPSTTGIACPASANHAKQVADQGQARPAASDQPEREHEVCQPAASARNATARAQCGPISSAKTGPKGPGSFSGRASDFGCRWGSGLHSESARQGAGHHR
jgi:hypothetical protein